MTAIAPRVLQYVLEYFYPRVILSRVFRLRNRPKWQLPRRQPPGAGADLQSHSQAMSTVVRVVVGSATDAQVVCIRLDDRAGEDDEEAATDDEIWETFKMQVLSAAAELNPHVEFAEVAIDASQIIWVATANDERSIPEPILNRMNVYEVHSPDRDAARAIASRLYASIRAQHDWGRRFDPEASDEVLDAMAELAPREMRRAWMTAFGNARLEGRETIERRDLPGAAARRAPIGFVH